MMKPRFMATLMAHPPMAVTMTYMQKLRKRRRDATGFSAMVPRVEEGWCFPFFYLLVCSRWRSEVSAYIRGDAQLVMFFACPDSVCFVICGVPKR